MDVLQAVHLPLAREGAVVGADGVHHAAPERHAHPVARLRRSDDRRELHERPEFFQVRMVEIKILGAALRIYPRAAPARRLDGLEQNGLAHVRHQHLAAREFGQGHGVERRDVFALGGSPVADAHVVRPVIGVDFLFRLIENGVALTVQHHRAAEGFDLAHDVEQHPLGEVRHAVQIAHEALEAQRAALPHGAQVFEVVDVEAAELAEIHHRARVDVGGLVFENLPRVDERVAPVMVDHGGDASPGRRLGARRPVLPVREARVHHVHVLIHHARQEMAARGVDLARGACFRLMRDGGDPPPLHVDAALVGVRGRHDFRVLDQKVGAHAVALS